MERAVIESSPSSPTLSSSLTATCFPARHLPIFRVPYEAPTGSTLPANAGAILRSIFVQSLFRGTSDRYCRRIGMADLLRADSGDADVSRETSGWRGFRTAFYRNSTRARCIGFKRHATRNSPAPGIRASWPKPARELPGSVLARTSSRRFAAGTCASIAGDRSIARRFAPRIPIAPAISKSRAQLETRSLRTPRPLRVRPDRSNESVLATRRASFRLVAMFHVKHAEDAISLPARPRIPRCDSGSKKR